ncbi:hypothetical protein [Crassaminicella profunda]|uniref:hypothetical protein n=1 Tax=Crassaminicella profunda TaxID=1286698 RepID=UPI001CA620DE|nr:hypothetical protein [Crassaminicella profunda]QZY55308.1 hypothetical protein K7H06_20280 [Crassaminicella profunda]
MKKLLFVSRVPFIHGMEQLSNQKLYNDIRQKILKDYFLTGKLTNLKNEIYIAVKRHAEFLEGEVYLTSKESKPINLSSNTSDHIDIKELIEMKKEELLKLRQLLDQSIDEKSFKIATKIVKKIKYIENEFML